MNKENEPLDYAHFLKYAPLWVQCVAYFKPVLTHTYESPLTTWTEYYKEVRGERYLIRERRKRKPRYYELGVTLP